MGDSQTSTSTTRPLNAHVTSTANNLLGGIDAAWARGPSTFNESLYTGTGATTNRGVQSLIASANNPAYSNGVQGAISSFGDTAAGRNIGVQAPGYQQVRSDLSNNIRTTNNSDFNNSGLFGSDNNQESTARGLTSGLGALDMQQYNNGLDRQVQAAGLLPGLYQASQQPASTLLTAGAIQDADAQARQQGRYDLSTRQGNAQTDLLGRLSSIFNGTSGAGGSQTTSSTPSTPWWQSLIGLGVGLA